MGGNPWDRNEGKFDVPSSSAPIKGEARNPGRPASLSRAVAAEEDPRAYHGVEPVFVVIDGLRKQFGDAPTPKLTRGKRIR